MFCCSKAHQPISEAAVGVLRGIYLAGGKYWPGAEKTVQWKFGTNTELIIEAANSGFDRVLLVMKLCGLTDN